MRINIWFSHSSSLKLQWGKIWSDHLCFVDIFILPYTRVLWSVQFNWVEPIFPFRATSNTFGALYLSNAISQINKNVFIWLPPLRHFLGLPRTLPEETEVNSEHSRLTQIIEELKLKHKRVFCSSGLTAKALHSEHGESSFGFLSRWRCIHCPSTRLVAKDLS